MQKRCTLRASAATHQLRDACDALSRHLACRLVAARHKRWRLRERLRMRILRRERVPQRARHAQHRLTRCQRRSGSEADAHAVVRLHLHFCRRCKRWLRCKPVGKAASCAAQRAQRRQKRSRRHGACHTVCNMLYVQRAARTAAAGTLACVPNVGCSVSSPRHHHVATHRRSSRPCITRATAYNTFSNESSSSSRRIRLPRAGCTRLRPGNACRHG